MIARLGRIAALGALALGLTFTAAPVRAQTIADTLILAYRHSGLMEKNRAVLRAADEDVAQAVATLRPIISYTLQAQRAYTSSTGQSASLDAVGQPTIDGGGSATVDSASLDITGQLLLWDGGASRLAIDAAKEAVLSTREGLRAVEQQVLGQAVSAFLAVREAIAFVNLRESNVALIGRELDAARERFEVGEVTRTDVAVAEAALASARSNLAAARGDYEIAVAQYIEITGQQPGNLAESSNLPEVANSLQAAQAVARQTHPTILRDMRLITVAELNVLRAAAAVRPQVSAGTSLSVDEEFTESASISLQMTGPIYRGGQLTSQYRQAVAVRDEERADLHVTVDGILQQVAQAWAQVEVARAQIQSGDLGVRAARIAFEGLQEEATLGARTTLDVLAAEQDLQDARATLISARTAEVLAIYNLLSAMGLLTVDHLNLGVATYDPSVYYNAVKDAPVRDVSPQGERLDSVLRAIGRN